MTSREAWGVGSSCFFKRQPAVVASWVLDAVAGALADKVVDPGDASGAGSLAYLAGVGVVLAAQEVLNLLTADCDGQVASGAFAWTATQLAGMAVASGPGWMKQEDNPGTESPRGRGDNSDYVVTYRMRCEKGSPVTVSLAGQALPCIHSVCRLNMNESGRLAANSGPVSRRLGELPNGLRAVGGCY